MGTGVFGTWKRVLLAGSLAALALSTACSDDGAGGEAATLEPEQQISASDIRGGEAGFLHRTIDREAPDFTLTDQDGNSVSLGDFAGEWVLVDWIYTNCKTVCPAMTAELNIVRNGLGDRVGDGVRIVSITFDPGRDTREVLKAYAEKVAGDAPGWSWLRGTKAQTDAVAAAYGVAYEDAPAMMGVAMFDHTALLVVIGPDGHERHRYFGVGWSGDVIKLLKAEAPLPEPAPGVAAASQSSPTEVLAGPAPVNGQAADLLADAIALPWEGWELEPGVTSQVLYQFPNSGQRAAYIDQARRDAEDQGASLETSELSGMRAIFISRPGNGASGIGYNQNLVVVVEAESPDAVQSALAALDDDWCCGL